MSMTSTPGTLYAVKSNASLGMGASTTFTVDCSTVNEGRLHIDNTPGGTVAVTRGLKVEIFLQAGSTAVYDTFAFITDTMPSAVASLLERKGYFLPTGKYNVKVTNLDVSNAITVGATLDTVS